jgi:hypothetical protein
VRRGPAPGIGWDGRSQGTLDTIDQAPGANLPVEIFDSNGHQVLIDDVT